MATFVIKGTDKYFESNALTKDKIKVYADDEEVTDANIVINSQSKLTENRTEGNTTTQFQYGIRCTISVSGYPTNKKQVKMTIPKGTLVDKSGNVNKDTDFIIYDTLKSTSEETNPTSAFLGNINIQRQNIENVTFVSNIENKNETAWDVSEPQNGSILAWYETQSNGTLKVYIGSDGAIYANTDSSYLFAYIGYASECTATENEYN